MAKVRKNLEKFWRWEAPSKETKQMSLFSKLADLIEEAVETVFPDKKVTKKSRKKQKKVTKPGATFSQGLVKPTVGAQLGSRRTTADLFSMQYRTNAKTVPISRLLEYYEAKGVKKPGDLVRIRIEETSWLIPDRLLSKDAAHERQFDMSFRYNPLAIDDSACTGVNWKKMIPVNHVYMHRGYDFSREHDSDDSKWLIAMFLGLHIEEEVPGESKAMWAKWLIDEQVLVGWIHPRAMIKIPLGKIVVEENADD